MPPIGAVDGAIVARDMRTGAARDHAGYFHETAFYDSDEALLEIVVPFLRDGAEAGEPTIVAFAARNAAIVSDALGGADGVTFIPGEERYARPAAAIRAYRDLFGTLVARGAQQIRVVGDVPHPGTGADWHAWRRYEAAVNHAYDAFPVWGICPYDTRTTPDDVLEDVARTHAHVATADGHHVNDRFEDPVAFTRAAPAPALDPVEATRPDALLADAAPALVRHAATDAAARSGLDAKDTEHLLLAVTELCSNAARHGRPPVVVRLWARPQRVVLSVTDTGGGVRDPWFGLLAPDGDDADAGYGLWLVHQVCTDVAVRRDAAGFTVRAGIGAPRVLPGSTSRT
jgi:anti-sigma regulatory factor (Ser/Thr protein kinase)